MAQGWFGQTLFRATRPGENDQVETVTVGEGWTRGSRRCMYKWALDRAEAGTVRMDLGNGCALAG